MSAATNLNADAGRCARNADCKGRARRSDAVVTQLVHRAAEGDQDAWNQLVEEFSALVWATVRAYRLSATDAAEVSQMTWLRLVENLERLRDPARVGGWLATTARRECVQVLRHTARVIPHADLPELVSNSPAPDATLLANERDDALWTALAALPERDRRLLRMLMADPAPSYSEISAALQMPIGSIGPTRERALQRLRREVRRRGLTCWP
jgi:RNA polymerase sigma factor (sigma-70 family)